MKIFERLFNRWKKWEIYKEDEPYILTTYFHFDGSSYDDHVITDIYVKTNKFTGLKKYKRVIKWR